MSGSWGTLGFFTEVIFKVLPRAERVATLVLRGLDDARAVEALSMALGSPFEVTGAAHLPAQLDGGGARTLIRIEGFSVSIDYRLGELKRLLKRFGAADVIGGDEAAALWRSVRDVEPLIEPRDRAVWRVSTAPPQGPAVMAQVSRAIEARWFYDWGGGLVWIATSAAGDGGAGGERGGPRGGG